MNTVDYICTAWDNDYEAYTLLTKDFERCNNSIEAFKKRTSSWQKIFLYEVAQSAFPWLDITKEDFDKAIEQWYNNYED